MTTNPSDFQDDPLKEILEADTQAAPPPIKPKGNRTFLLLIVVLVILTALALIFLVGIAPRLVRQQQASQAEQAAIIYAANTATIAAATEQAYLANLALTPSATVQPSATLAPTSTPLLAQPSATATSEISLADQAHTQTLAAMQTQVSSNQTQVALTSSDSSLPATGGGSIIGPIIGLVSIVGVLITLIIVLRSLRSRINH